MNLSESIDAYLAYRRLQRYADNTLEIDRQTLSSLVAEVGDLKLSSMGPQHVDRWLAARSAICQPSTLNTQQQVLRSWEKWLHQRALLSPRQSLTGHLRNYRIMPKRRLIIPAAEFSRVLDAATDPTDRLIVSLGMFLFLRQGELSTLTVSDARLSEGLMDVTVHKSRVRDVMPICRELDVELRRYLTWRSERSAVLPGQFLACAKNAGFGPGGVVRQCQPRPNRQVCRPFDAVHRVLRKAGFEVPPGEGCHTLRRSGATALYQSLRDQGHDHAIRICQAMLHHASVTTTERYLSIDADRKVRDDLFRGREMFPDVASASVSLIRLGEGVTASGA